MTCLVATGSTSGAVASVASTVSHEQIVSSFMLEQQIRFTVGLLQTLLNDQEQQHLNKNILLSPHGLVSTLTSLLPGNETETRVQLARTLLHHKINSKLYANDYVRLHTGYNEFTLQKNERALRVNTFQYRDLSFPFNSNAHVKKLFKKYQTIGKELQLINGEKLCMETLNSINRDSQQFKDEDTKTPILSTVDYASLVNSSIQTILVISVHFKGLWSKSFELQYGKFRTSNGQLVKSEMLYKIKSFPYYEDRQSMSSAIKMNFRHEGTVSMVLILPNENISVQHYVKHMLDYDTLKRILKNLGQFNLLSGTRHEVALTLPKFSLTTNSNMVNPVQCLNKLLPNDPNESTKNGVAIASLDEKVLLVQRLSIQVDQHGVSNATSGLKLFSRKEAQFKADRPFLYLIVTNGVPKQILLAGVCNNPTID